VIIGLVAQPWWVNLIVLIPPVAYFYWRRGGVPLSPRQLAASGVFAASFGFVEAVVVVYLGCCPITKGHSLSSYECQGSFTGTPNRSGSFHLVFSLLKFFARPQRF